MRKLTLMPDAPAHRIPAGFAHTGISAGFAHTGISAGFAHTGISAGFAHTGISAGFAHTGISAGFARVKISSGFTRAAAILFLVLLSGCDGRGSGQSTATIPPTSFGGDPGRGVHLIAQAGCGSCHAIPGITGADGLVGPPLDRMGRRVFIAGLLRNTPDNMIRWLRDPQSVVPGNAMPDMGLDDQQARDVAAYLYTLD